MHIALLGAGHIGGSLALALKQSGGDMHITAYDLLPQHAEQLMAMGGADAVATTVADAVRGILDGHIVLDREIAQRGRYPAIDILKSISRSLPNANNEFENQLLTVARRFMATYENMAELIRLGAYRRGTDPEVDRAMQFYPQLESFISQREHEAANLDEGYELLAKVLGLSGDKK